MTKQEFLDILGKILKRELCDTEVAENIRYYEQYIAQQMSTGKSEEAVLRELGDPRLIARTILQVDQKSYTQESVYTEEEGGTFRQEPRVEDREDSAFQVKTINGLKSWLVLILVVIVIVMLVSTVFRIALKLLPLILIAAAAVWIYREFVKK